MKEFDKKGFKLKFANNIESDAISLIDNNVFSLDDLSKLNSFDETCFYAEMGGEVSDTEKASILYNDNQIFFQPKQLQLHHVHQIV